MVRPVSPNKQELGERMGKHGGRVWKEQCTPKDQSRTVPEKRAGSSDGEVEGTPEEAGKTVERAYELRRLENVLTTGGDYTRECNQLVWKG